MHLDHDGRKPGLLQDPQGRAASDFHTYLRVQRNREQHVRIQELLKALAVARLRSGGELSRQLLRQRAAEVFERGDQALDVCPQWLTLDLDDREDALRAGNGCDDERGDAEEESWETWEYKKVEDLHDLLRCTVLYKVGHHGSINATLIEGGLDKMTNDDELTALIPVDKVRAHRNEWNFPAPSLYEELERRTQGRIILNCEDTECPTCEPSYDKENFDENKVSIFEDGSRAKLWLDYVIKL